MTSRRLPALLVIAAACGAAGTAPPAAPSTPSAQAAPSAQADCVYRERFDVIPDRIWFAPGSAEPSADAQVLLDALAQTIVANSQIQRIAVVGAAAADERDGAALALRRATAVIAALVARGVAGEHLEPRSHAGVQDRASVWFVTLAVDGQPVAPVDPRDPLAPFDRHCDEQRTRHARDGTPIDCDCKPSAR